MQAGWRAPDGLPTQSPSILPSNPDREFTLFAELWQRVYGVAAAAVSLGRDPLKMALIGASPPAIEFVPFAQLLAGSYLRS